MRIAVDAASFDGTLPPELPGNLRTRADVSFHVDSESHEYVKLMISKAKSTPGEPKVPLLLDSGGKYLEFSIQCRRFGGCLFSTRCRSPGVVDAEHAALSRRE